MADLFEMLKDKRLLIFDFDGTVADTSLLHATAFSQVLSPLGIAMHYPDIAGLSTPDAMRKCLDDVGRKLGAAELDELVAAKQKFVRQLIGEALRPLPGIDAFLRAVRQRYRLAMVTSGSRGTVSLGLKSLGYADWFNPLICGDDVKNAKPAPEGFLRALQIANVPASNALVFEDSDAGLEAAAKAGLPYVDVRRIAWHAIEGPPQ